MPKAPGRFIARSGELRERLIQQEIEGLEWQELSMGMTADFEVAIEEGATLVRVGTAILARVHQPRSMAEIKERPMLEQVRFAFIGGGNMADALIKGLLSGLGVTPQQIIATDVVPERRPTCKRRMVSQPQQIIISTPSRRAPW